MKTYFKAFLGRVQVVYKYQLETESMWKIPFWAHVGHCHHFASVVRLLTTSHFNLHLQSWSTPICSNGPLEEAIKMCANWIQTLLYFDFTLSNLSNLVNPPGTGIIVKALLSGGLKRGKLGKLFFIFSSTSK